MKGGEIAAAEDPKAATDAIGKLWLSAMTSGATQGDAAGGSTKEAALGPFAESRGGECRKRLRDIRGWKVWVGLECLYVANYIFA